MPITWKINWLVRHPEENRDNMRFDVTVFN